MSAISQFYILSSRGDTIISRDYRGDVARGTPEIFFRKVKFWEPVLGATPLLRSAANSRAALQLCLLLLLDSGQSGCVESMSRRCLRSAFISCRLVACGRNAERGVGEKGGAGSGVAMSAAAHSAS